MTDLPRWGIVTTLSAPAEQVLAFVAHHLDLGAQRIWLHFDDPDDPAAALLSGRKQVVVTRCDTAYWAELGGRPETHQMRQVKNCTRVLRRAKLDWIAHIDVDEFIIADQPIPPLLADLPQDRLILRLEPWEALHDPDLPEDIFTATAFRRQIQSADPAELTTLYGPQATLLEHGMLSHTVGKCFFRTGIPGMVGRIHGARLNGEVLFGGRFHPDLALLHFHAQDPKAWLGRLGFRLAKGAYQYRPAMQAWLQQASDTEIERFYHQIQAVNPKLLEALGTRSLLRREQLSLRQKIRARFPDLTPPPEAPFDAKPS